MAKDLPKPKKPIRSNSFVIPLATVSGLLILFLIYVFWYVSAEDKYYNDRAFRVLSVLSESDRKSTRLNSSHSQISYAVFCLKQKIARVVTPQRRGSELDAQT